MRASADVPDTGAQTAASQWRRRQAAGGDSARVDGGRSGDDTRSQCRFWSSRNASRAATKRPSPKTKPGLTSSLPSALPCRKTSIMPPPAVRQLRWKRATSLRAASLPCLRQLLAVSESDALYDLTAELNSCFPIANLRCRSHKVPCCQCFLILCCEQRFEWVPAIRTSADR